MQDKERIIKKPLYEGDQIRCYRVNGRGGKRMLIEAGPYEYTLEELKVLFRACRGETQPVIDREREVGGSHNMRWRLRKRNDGVPLSYLYENAVKLGFNYPFVLQGLEQLLADS